ncbi:hypothetical protein Mnod_7633 [Methylobacterium nodulans ORS 2060]|uniref:Uncharacterized protein n=1 Tax=Methylobacterium nodulans (strain LMG 21967 / CNCM I-2342 / ORS 2060) TaxID=460265 RepID=B8IQS1_METNO|nr:hypothetical protein Mnod_7633 [Methylobacterium nodulans ORS 2060]
MGYGDNRVSSDQVAQPQHGTMQMPHCDGIAAEHLLLGFYHPTFRPLRKAAFPFASLDRPSREAMPDA